MASRRSLGLLVLACCALTACAGEVTDARERIQDSLSQDAAASTPETDAGAIADDSVDAGREGMMPGNPRPDGAAPDAAEPVDWAAVEVVLAEIRAGSRYHKPTPQDAASPGVYPAEGEIDARSEPVAPPFIMAPRRQTDSMVRQLYALLPIETRRDVAFVIPDRIAQDPDAYLPYLRSRKSVVLVGNFVGIGTATADQAWFVERHDTELWMAEVTLRLCSALGLEVTSIRYTMGDSTSGYASAVRADLEARLHGTLDTLGKPALKSPVTWGADEAVPVALAATLPTQTIRVRYANANATHHYDGNKTSREVVEPKLTELGLREVSDGADLELVVLNNVTGDDGTLPSSSNQLSFDQDTFGWVHELASAERKNLIIVDGRMFNGALDDYSAPAFCDYLAYGAWGTFANKVGTTLATAKIVFASKNEGARRALLLEALAHDVYANGYRDGRDGFKPRLSARGVTFDHSGGYSLADTQVVFDVLNAFVSERMTQHYQGTGCLAAGERVRFTAQLFRTFESEAHLIPTPQGAPAVVGVYRTDLPAKFFDPRGEPQLQPLTLDDLLKE